MNDKTPTQDEPQQDGLSSLRNHPVFGVAQLLAGHLGVERSLLYLIEFLSLAGGRMVAPINLEILTGDMTADLFTVNNMLELAHARIARVDTHKQFRGLERQQFKGLAIILVRGTHPSMFRDFTECMARIPLGDSALPSLWRISNDPTPRPPVSTTLRLHTEQMSRSFRGFGRKYVVATTANESTELKNLIERLPVNPEYPCKFRAEFESDLCPDIGLILERVLLTVAAVRVRLPGSHDTSPEILRSDYVAARALLTNLPLTPADRQVSPSALKTAEAVYGQVIKDVHYQLSLPDLSAEGNKWFNRNSVLDWLDLSYNSVKKHLEELEQEGILLSTVARSDRKRGVEIHYKFAPAAEPPFGWINPFEVLPEL